jgi:hypothetical protein
MAGRTRDALNIDSQIQHIGPQFPNYPLSLYKSIYQSYTLNSQSGLKPF